MCRSYRRVNSLSYWKKKQCRKTGVVLNRGNLWKHFENRERKYCDKENQKTDTKERLDEKHEKKEKEGEFTYTREPETVTG